MMQTGRYAKATRAHLEQAASFQAQGLLQEAILELEKAARLASNKIPVYKELAGLYRSQRQVDDAIGAMRKVLLVKPDDIEAREMLLEMFLELGKFDDAIGESMEMLRMNSRSLSARDALYFAYMHMGLLDKALRITNELITLDPVSPFHHYKKAFVQHERGEIGDAIHELGRVLDMHPDEQLAQDVQQALEKLDSYQMRHIVTLALEDCIFRAKLIHDPETAVLERGYYLSQTGMAALRQIQFDELPEISVEWKQRYYH
jgi:tetratricopeptide (TPR) repeat protein